MVDRLSRIYYMGIFLNSFSNFWKAKRYPEIKDAFQASLAILLYLTKRHPSNRKKHSTAGFKNMQVDFNVKKQSH